MAVGMAADPDAHGRIAALEAALAPWDGGRSYLNFSEQRTDRARFFAPQTLRRLRRSSRTWPRTTSSGPTTRSKLTDA